MMKLSVRVSLFGDNQCRRGFATDVDTLTHRMRDCEGKGTMKWSEGGNPLGVGFVRGNSFDRLRYD